MVEITAPGEVENSGDSVSPACVAEGELQMGSDPGARIAAKSLKDEINEQKETEKIEEKELVSSSSSSSSSGQFQESVFLSPGFRSAVAMAGWDAETLLLAALSQSPIVSGDGGHDMPAPTTTTTTQDASHVTHAAARKRDKRTPLSSARRNRRVRWEGSNGSPLGRLPMKPLTLLSDNEVEDSSATNEKCLFSAAEGKENCNPEPSTCTKENEMKGKEKEQTPTGPPCLDLLREELSCAVCLDICFEPSTISCGHSFCGTCLQSVLQKCGPRCPKCRQPVRGEALRNCRINTVLWNTIQILFPKESAAKIQDQQRHRDEEAAKKAVIEEHHSRRNLGTRPSRLQPWRSSPFFNNLSRVSVMGNLRSSFQAASELMTPSSRQREHDSTSQQPSPLTYISREDWERSRQDTQEAADLPRGQSSSRSRSRRQSRATQEQVDAALAARLQQAELDPGSDVGELLIVEEPREVTRAQSNQTMRPRYATVAVAATNLRTVASRAARQHRVRTLS